LKGKAQQDVSSKIHDSFDFDNQDMCVLQPRLHLGWWYSQASIAGRHRRGNNNSNGPPDISNAVGNANSNGNGIVDENLDDESPIGNISNPVQI
jgi:hypothetical protein